MLVLVNFAFFSGAAKAEGSGGQPGKYPGQTVSPSEWTEDSDPSTSAYPAGTRQPEQGPPLFLVGSTLVAPPPVSWLGDRPSDPGRVFGVGEAASFVKALELILPAGWTIWSSEDIRRLNRVVGERVLWDGNGRPWPDVLESLARQYGVEISADYASRRAVVGLAASADAEGPAQSVGGARMPSTGPAAPTAPQPGFSEPDETQTAHSHPAYREFVTPTRLSAEPLPDTIGRIAWRLAPPGVQMDLAALGAYINAPVFQWDFSESLVSPQSALAALMPSGYCLDQGGFPLVIVVACDEPLSTGKSARIREFDENSP